jgi:hypothetical protein
MTNTHKHAFVILLIGGFLLGAYGKQAINSFLDSLEISQACDNNRTACEMQGVEI